MALPSGVGGGGVDVAGTAGTRVAVAVSTGTGVAVAVSGGAGGVAVSGGSVALGDTVGMAVSGTAVGIAVAEGGGGVTVAVSGATVEVLDGWAVDVAVSGATVGMAVAVGGPAVGVAVSGGGGGVSLGKGSGVQVAVGGSVGSGVQVGLSVGGTGVTVGVKLSDGVTVGTGVRVRVGCRVLVAVLVGRAEGTTTIGTLVAFSVAVGRVVAVTDGVAVLSLPEPGKLPPLAMIARNSTPNRAKAPPTTIPATTIRRGGGALDGDYRAGGHARGEAQVHGGGGRTSDRRRGPRRVRHRCSRQHRRRGEGTRRRAHLGRRQRAARSLRGSGKQRLWRRGATGLATRVAPPAWLSTPRKATVRLAASGYRSSGFLASSLRMIASSAGGIDRLNWRGSGGCVLHVLHGHGDRVVGIEGEPAGEHLEEGDRPAHRGRTGGPASRPRACSGER